MTKVCSKCEEEKNLSEFYKNSGNKDGLSYGCKSCKDLHNKRYRERNKEKVRKMKAEYQRRRMDKVRDSHYRKKYGITLDTFNSLFEEQNGACAICGTTDYSDRMKYAKLVVDHCHSSDEVRGLLCKSCNIGLGEFKDDPELLLSAVEYLNE